MGKKHLLILGFILALPTALAHMESGQHSILEWSSLQHIIVLAIAAIVAAIGFVAASKTKKQSLNYLVAGAIAIGLIHLIEVVSESLQLITLSESALSGLEHMLMVIGLILMGFGFYLMKTEKA